MRAQLQCFISGRARTARVLNGLINDFLDLHNVFFENYFANELTRLIVLKQFKTFAVRVLSGLNILGFASYSLYLIKHCCSLFFQENSLRNGSEKGEPARNPLLCHFRPLSLRATPTLNRCQNWPITQIVYVCKFTYQNEI